MAMSTIKSLIPPSINAVLRWRLAVMFVLLSLSFLAAWGVGVLPWSSGVAMADDVDSKIQQALHPIQTQISQNTGFLKTLVLSDYAESIRGSIRARCKTDDTQEKARLNREIDDKQIEYKEISNDEQRYPEPDCEDL